MQSRNSITLCKSLVRRLDRCVEAMNVVLVVLAVGLAALDATCFMPPHLGGAVAPMSEVTTVTAPPASHQASG